MYEKINELIAEQKYTLLRKELIALNEADTAALIEELPLKELVIIFRLLPKSIAANVFVYLPIEREHELITSLTDREAASIIDSIDSDDATNLLEEMPANVVTRLLSKADPETRRDINHLLQYPENSAGSMMSVEFIDIKDNLNVAQALDFVRTKGSEINSLDVCYVIDTARHLIGYITLRSLLIGNTSSSVTDIMESNVIKANTLDDQEEVALMFQKYDLITMPVVDSENRLVGIVTVDDVVDVLQQEATEDIEKMAAITPSERPYMKMGVFEIWKNRIPWLLLLMISATFTGQILKAFENALAAQVTLTLFIPMLMDSAGNAGGQSSVTIIRGLSLGEIEFKNIFKIIWKEFRVALACGITLAAANMIKMLLIDRVSFMIALVVCSTLMITLIFAKIVGCILPILTKRIGFDPAVMASPFITTIVDAIALIVYFQMATLLLHI